MQHSGAARMVNYSQAFFSKASGAGVFEEAHRGMAWYPRFSDAWSMHTVAHMPFACCFLPENEGHGPALPADSPWQWSRGIYCLLPLLWDCISQDSCISSHLPLMFPKFNYHLTVFVASTLPLMCACGVCLWLCVRYSILIRYLSRLNRTHRFANYKQNLKPQALWFPALLLLLQTAVVPS